MLCTGCSSQGILHRALLCNSCTASADRIEVVAGLVGPTKDATVVRFYDRGQVRHTVGTNLYGATVEDLT